MQRDKRAAQSWAAPEQAGWCYVQHSLGGSWRLPLGEGIFSSPLGSPNGAEPAKSLVQL